MECEDDATEQKVKKEKKIVTEPKEEDISEPKAKQSKKIVTLPETRYRHVVYSQKLKKW